MNGRTYNPNPCPGWRQRLLLAVLVVCIVGGCFPPRRGGGGSRSGAGDVEVDRAIQAYNEGKFELAVERFNLALEKGVNRHSRALVQTMLGNAYNELGRFEESIAAHKEALQLDPRDHKAWNNLGVSYRQVGNFNEAANCYEKALELKPDYAEGLASHGVLLILSNQPEKAIASLEKAIDVDPSIAVAHGNLALAYASVGRFEDAEARLKSATVLGYKNGPEIAKRIEALKALVREEDSAPTPGAVH